MFIVRKFYLSSVSGSVLKNHHIEISFVVTKNSQITKLAWGTLRPEIRHWTIHSVETGKMSRVLASWTRSDGGASSAIRISMFFKFLSSLLPLVLTDTAAPSLVNSGFQSLAKL